MHKCEWCGRTVELVQYKDAIGEVHNICKSCKTKVDSCKCRKCGTIVDPNMMIDGLCTNCIQVKMRDKSRKREEAMMGVDSDPFLEARELQMTNEDYERWLTFDSTYSPKDMKESRELRRLWILVKLNAVGIYDNELISNNFVNIELLLNRNFSKLVNNKCKIVIDNSSEVRKVIRNSDVIDYEYKVYILQA